MTSILVSIPIIMYVSFCALSDDCKIVDVFFYVFGYQLLRCHFVSQGPIGAMQWLPFLSQTSVYVCMGYLTDIPRPWSLVTTGFKEVYLAFGKSGQSSFKN